MLELNTFSIVARCPRSGLCGVAVASAIPCVGAISSFAAPSAGAVATQSWCNPYLGIAGIEQLRQGLPAAAVLAALIASDASPNLRQLGIVDDKGRSVAWTGRECTPWAGHRTGEGYAVQGNMLAGEHVLVALEAAFLAAPEAELSDRLVAALQAGERAGGDRRGKQSASVLVFASEAYPWVDVRVDDHARPCEELRRVHDIAVLQLTPFIRDMPTRTDTARMVSAETATLLSLPPPARPGGGGSGP